MSRDPAVSSPSEVLLAATSYELEAALPEHFFRPSTARSCNAKHQITDETRAKLHRIIAAVGANGVTLDQALEIVLVELGDALDGPVGRVHRVGFAADAWRVRDGLQVHEARCRLDGKLEMPSAIELKAVADLRDCHVMDALRSAGLHGVVTLPVLAEDRPVAAVQLFSRRVPLGSELAELLGILTAQLSRNAGLERMREAVRNVAQHARTMIKSMEELRTHSDLFDSLTGFPGTSILEDRIRQCIRRRQRSSRSTFAVLLVQDEGLQRVRDALGGTVAGEVLLAMGRRLSGLLRPADTVARDGSRFVVVLEEVLSLDEAMEVAERVRRELLRPFPAGPTGLKPDPAVGVVFGGPAYDTVEALLGDAEVALRRARESNRRVELFDAFMDGSEERRQQIETELASALQRKDFFLEYQPIVSLEDGAITALEAFIRWRHPELGVVPPSVFIPVAITSPLVHQLGYWVIERTCQQIRRWQDNLAPRTPPPVALNVAGRQLFHREFVDRVREILDRNGVVGGQIRFDISETDLMKDTPGAEHVLDAIRDMGIKIAIDDFGTGYSSLSLLHRLPVHALKIDRSFVSRSPRQLRRGGVARTIVLLAKNLELEVIAEGIETKQQFLHLRSTGCTLAQGFYFSGPVGAADAETLIREGYPINLGASAAG